jgi:hypothetical protein
LHRVELWDDILVLEPIPPQVNEALRLVTPLIDLELMQEIRDYNEVDCKVIMEVVQYLRERH